MIFLFLSLLIFSADERPSYEQNARTAFEKLNPTSLHPNFSQYQTWLAGEGPDFGQERTALGVDQGKVLSRQVAASKGTMVWMSPQSFADGVAQRFAGSPAVVGFISGNSAAGHNDRVIDVIKVMIDDAKTRLQLNEKGYVLVTGASTGDGGINDKLSSGLAKGQVNLPGDPKNVRIVGAVSENAASKPMIQGLSDLYVGPDAEKQYSMMGRDGKALPGSSEVVARTSKKMGADVHWMTLSGGESGLIELLTKVSTTSGQKMLLQLAVGTDAVRAERFSGTQASDMFVRFLATNPTALEKIEKSGVEIIVVDEKTLKAQPLGEYLESDAWKNRLKTQQELVRNFDMVAETQNLAKLEALAKSETKAEKLADLEKQIGTLKGRIAQARNWADVNGLIKRSLDVIAPNLGNKSTVFRAMREATSRGGKSAPGKLEINTETIRRGSKVR